MGYADKIEVRYNPNGIEIPDRLLEQWKHSQKVRSHYSVDSIGAMNDYITSSDWQHNLKQFELLDKRTSNNVEVTIACAANVQTFITFRLSKWKLQHGSQKQTCGLGAGGINYLLCILVLDI